MSQDFWHHVIADKSFATLQTLRREYDFVLIGGWAVFLFSHALKSKDIDIIVEPSVLGLLKTKFDVIKNDRLKKYEIKLEGFDVDIYLPHWSELGLPVEYVFQNSLSREGFKVPEIEILFVLKLFTYSKRKGSLKGKKDALDLVSLLRETSFPFTNVHQILKKYGLENLKKELRELLASTFEVRELNLNAKQYADFKRKVLSNIENTDIAK